ncbi:ATPase family AAA domain-containing protein 1-A-like [Sphaeramia orbicularis]|uniref:outer mitochondrial transmembrane helix translocase n=1 Tax=Sphaeramia orbicularis TaxID=375764 RepID=UPI00117D2804|nr:ATPase family AAA domain-containing protein 1-A-like [Sphaeramia orbicularis]XP_029999587.1 ATPase family AAA domain-containing protein 1-A-like [Sphaeramia orbicularis]XP_029999589.1 ATPase family AAA domain-containing protein 1-A-like [Sphaeramia orbicularis]XP_029999590.1 ATPase family AAA domain-containing protein 1-A-like [Sphaeramia orbicularis]XP_029999623.1 ATPase family AAA domain-containing protein 1-A-like [Sphaeramia orbicularis]XP_029999624.1 ATPase family AAA domain-containing
MLLKDLPREALLRPLSRGEVVGMLLRLTIFGAATYYSIKWVVEAMDPTHKQKNQAKKRAEQLMKRIGVEGVSLTEYEMNIASHLVDPQTMKVTWRDIAGLDDIINELQDTVILPFQKRHLLAGSKLFQPPKGVLLFGPPGCGKTMIAKATARASGCKFINLQASTLTDMWYGESQKLTAAVFSLAVKIQPCIIFIDEIESFLRNRSSLDHEATAMMKAQFMSLWDGLDTSSTTQVMVMGATNRPQDVDPAILRRMPTTFHVGLPNTRQRQDILRLILAGENLSNAINLKDIAEKTEGYSGSDLRELCRDAAMYRVRDYVRKEQMRQIAQQLQDSEEEEEKPVDEERLRPVTQLDLLFGLDKMNESKRATASMLPSISEVPLD